VTGCEGSDDRVRRAQARMMLEVTLRTLQQLPTVLPELLGVVEAGEPAAAGDLRRMLADAAQAAAVAVDPAHRATLAAALVDIAGLVRGAGASDDTAAAWETLLRISDVLDRARVTGGAS
jgi:hypothetical protein